MQDMQHRCIARTAPEEWNLAANWDSHDATIVEFIRTYMTQDFQGGALLRRYEAEISPSGNRSVTKALPKIGDQAPSDSMYLRCFDDVYGFRAKNEGKGRLLYYLNPWEFLMLWDCVPLPPPPSPLSMKVGDSYQPNPAAESSDVIFFPLGIPGEVDFRNRYYMRRRHRPMIPAPNGTPMPDQRKYAKKKYLLFSLYMRQWTLCDLLSCKGSPRKPSFQAFLGFPKAFQGPPALAGR